MRFRTFFRFRFFGGKWRSGKWAVVPFFSRITNFVLPFRQMLEK